MNSHIRAIATALIGITLLTGCGTANNNSTSNNIAAKTTSGQSQTIKANMTNTALVKQISPTNPHSHALPAKPDKYTASPEWVTSKLVYVIGWDKKTNPKHALFVSHNAGHSWTKVSTPLGDNIFQVHFQTPTTGIICGATQNSELIMYRTNDGGTHWIEESYPSRITRGASTYGAPQISFVTLDHKLTWLMATWNDNQFPRHALYHSDNNGITWGYSNNNSSIAAEGYLSNFYAPDRQTAYFVSFCPQCGIPDTTNMTGTNTLEITYDAGRTWTKIALPFTGENQVQKLVFADNKHGTAIVRDAMTNAVTNYATNDGGYHWSKEQPIGCQ